MATGKFKYKTDVYYVPGTYSPSMGYCNQGETVTILWNVWNTSYCYIQYSGSGGQKRGYVPKNSFSSTSGTIGTVYYNSGANNASLRYVHTACTTYLGPSSSYVAAGSVSKNEEVVFLGPRDDRTNYVLIEYWINTAQKKHGWVYAKNLGTTPL